MEAADGKGKERKKLLVRRSVAGSMDMAVAAAVAASGMETKSSPLPCPGYV
jgi:hypothetical protein